MSAFTSFAVSVTDVDELVAIVVGDSAFHGVGFGVALTTSAAVSSAVRNADSEERCTTFIHTAAVREESAYLAICKVVGELDSRSKVNRRIKTVWASRVQRTGGPFGDREISPEIYS